MSDNLVRTSIPGNVWKAHPVRNQHLLQVGARDVIGVPPGGVPPDQEPDWDNLLTGGIVKPEGKPYRPSQWSQGQLYGVRQILPVADSEEGAVEINTYYFDAVLRADHSQSVQVTHHPIQTGAAVSDHAFVEPAQLVLNVGFSDVLDRYTDTDYAPGTSKSVSAWEAFIDLQQQRQPLTVFTRLKQYTNMVLTEVQATEDSRTVQSVKMTLTFQQIIMAQVSDEIASSQREHQSEDNQTGVKGATTPASTTDKYKLKPAHTPTNFASDPTSTAQAPTGLNVIGAGTYSSTTTGIRGGLPPV